MPLSLRLAECRLEVDASAPESLDEALERAAARRIGMVEAELLDACDDVVERGDDVGRRLRAAVV